MNELSASQLLQLILVALTVVIGQVLFKYGSINGPPGDSITGIVRLLLQPVVLVALVLYALGVVLWVVTLQQVSLTRAYPFMALGFVLTPVAAALIFNEPVDRRYVAGTALILAGIYLTSAPR